MCNFDHPTSTVHRGVPHSRISVGDHWTAGCLKPPGAPRVETIDLPTVDDFVTLPQGASDLGFADTIDTFPILAFNALGISVSEDVGMAGTIADWQSESTGA